jgi:4-hydroxybenzoyl-CoA thioesterase
MHPKPVAVETLAPLWRAPVKIRFGQCDAAGILYMPNYFDVFNGVLEEFFSAVLGLDYYGLMRDEGIVPGYAHAEADFFAPSVTGERLEVAVAVEKIGGASFTLVFHGLKAGAEVVRGRFVVVTAAGGTFRPIPLPEPLRAALARYRDRCAV